MEFLTDSVERIGVEPFVPSLLGIDLQCLTVLERSLLAVAPEEGCCLLLGRGLRTPRLSLVTLWPTCNAWGQSDWIRHASGDRETRFALDPREQIAAQRWARVHGLEVLGVCHSHPKTAPDPSTWDCDWAEPNQLMLILSGKRELRAWWLGADRVPFEIPIEVWENQIHAAKSSHPTSDPVL